MAPHWTMRKSGTVRATLRLDIHVPKEMVDWLRDHAGMREGKAIAWDQGEHRRPPRRMACPRDE